MNDICGVEIHKIHQNFGQVVICKGCCCGNLEHGGHPVPIEWLEKEWKDHDLLRNGMGLTVSGCIGICKPTNLVCIMTQTENIWLVGITKQEEYALLVQWVKTIKEKQTIVPLPDQLLIHKVVKRFRE